VTGSHSAVRRRARRSRPGRTRTAGNVSTLEPRPRITPRTAIRERVQCRVPLEHPDGIVRAEHGHRGRQADPGGPRGDRGEHHIRRRQREVVGVVPPDADLVRADLVRQDGLVARTACSTMSRLAWARESVLSCSVVVTSPNVFNLGRAVAVIGGTPQVNAFSWPHIDTGQHDRACPCSGYPP
jgi:hypothetical protein